MISLRDFLNCKITLKIKLVQRDKNESNIKERGWFLKGMEVSSYTHVTRSPLRERGKEGQGDMEREGEGGRGRGKEYLKG